MRKYLLVLLILNIYFTSPLRSVRLDGNLDISGGTNDLQIEIKTSSTLAGAISSLTVNGTELVDRYDHGREIQYAFLIGAALNLPNPTEAGGNYDGISTRISTSIFLDGFANNNLLHTHTRMAYWEPVNGIKVSPYEISKTVVIGCKGMPNLICFRAAIHISKDGSVDLPWVISAPAIYLVDDFDDLDLYNKSTGLYRPLLQNEITIYPAANVTTSWIPSSQVPILSNAEYSLAVYMPIVEGGSLLGYSYALYGNEHVVQNNIEVLMPSLQAGDTFYESYILISRNENIVRDITNMLMFLSPGRQPHIRELVRDI